MSKSQHMDDFLPCPFCGEKPVLEELAYGYNWEHACTDYGPIISINCYFDELEQAKKSWNKRITPLV